MKKKYMKPNVLVVELQHIQPIMAASGNDPVQEMSGEEYGGEGGNTGGSIPN